MEDEAGWVKGCVGFGVVGGDGLEVVTESAFEIRGAVEVGA